MFGTNLSTERFMSEFSGQWSIFKSLDIFWKASRTWSINLKLSCHAVKEHAFNQRAIQENYYDKLINRICFCQGSASPHLRGMKNLGYFERG